METSPQRPIVPCRGRHARQRVVVRHNGARVQVCCTCLTVLAVLPSELARRFGYSVDAMHEADGVTSTPAIT